MIDKIDYGQVVTYDLLIYERRIYSMQRKITHSCTNKIYVNRNSNGRIIQGGIIISDKIAYCLLLCDKIEP